MFDSHSDLAAIAYDGDERPDALLSAFAEKVIARGYKPAGLIQTNSCEGGALAVQLLPAAEHMLIGEARGPGARGCILDVGRLLDAGMRISDALKNGADVLIINRFGKQEADGKGLLFLIEEAIAQDIPVIIAVARSRWDLWISFAQGMSVLLPSNLGALTEWWDKVSAGKDRPPMNAPAGECHALFSVGESDAVVTH